MRRKARSNIERDNKRRRDLSEVGVDSHACWIKTLRPLIN